MYTEPKMLHNDQAAHKTYFNCNNNTRLQFQQLDLTIGTNYNQYLIMVKCGEPDGGAAL